VCIGFDQQGVEALGCPVAWCVADIPTWIAGLTVSDVGTLRFVPLVHCSRVVAEAFGVLVVWFSCGL